MCPVDRVEKARRHCARITKEEAHQDRHSSWAGYPVHTTRKVMVNSSSEPPALDVSSLEDNHTSMPLHCCSMVFKTLKARASARPLYLTVNLLLADYNAVVLNSNIFWAKDSVLADPK